MQPIVRSLLVYVRIPLGTGTGTPIQFPDQPTLNGTFITGIEVYGNNTLLLAPDRTPVVAQASLPDYALTLFDGSDARHKFMPAVALDTLQQSGIWHEFTPFMVNWQKSQVVYLGAAPTGAEASLPCLVHYFRPEDARTNS